VPCAESGRDIELTVLLILVIIGGAIVAVISAVVSQAGARTTTVDALTPGHSTFKLLSNSRNRKGTVRIRRV
jgi:hypothetical protein